jgi:catechol 2,3-dioxygenase-like lactoylglutathione lyase family enzyme
MNTLVERSAEIVAYGRMIRRDSADVLDESSGGASSDPWKPRTRRSPMAVESRPTRVSQVGTVGIPVADQDRALAFYSDQLGFETRMDASYEGGRWVEVAPPGAATSLALVQSRDGYAPGVDTGIRLSTYDAAADHATLRARGVQVGDLIPYPVPMFLFQDVDGNTLIIVERPAEP